MHFSAHLLLFLLSAAVIWALSGMLIDATDRVARRYNRPGFAVAFFVLGLLTSVSEASVAVNATIEGVPQVSAGNLIGASMVILLLIMPMLAVLGNGIPMTRAMGLGNLAFLLFVVFLPVIFTFDGSITASEGLLLILLYMVMLYAVQKRRPAEETAKEVVEETEHELLHRKHANTIDILKIVVGAILIFVAGNRLVEESVYVATLLSIPVSFVGLLLLSVGTNIPEIVIAIRCVLGRHKDIAFGDYMGSAAANTLLFGFLPLFNGTFSIERTEVQLVFPVFLIGLVLFFLFSRSKSVLSRKEGMTLLALYVLFLIFQIANMFRIAQEPGPLEAYEPEVEVRASVMEAGDTAAQ